MSHRFLSRKLCVAAGLAAFALSVGTAHAQANVQEEAREALRQAREARDQARRALEAADNAVAAAERALGTPASSPAPSAQTLPNIRAPGIQPVAGANAHFCQNPASILGAVERFELQCLDLGSWADYSSTNLNVTLSGASEGGVIEVGPVYTRRWRSRAAPYRSSYLRIAPTFRAQVGSGTSTAAFLDVDDFDLEAGWGGSLGIEWGRNALPPQIGSKSELAVVTSGLERAQRECMADFLARESAGQAQPGIADRSHREAWEAGWTEGAADTPAPPCSGENLASWMRSDSTRRSGYYSSFIRPLWGYDATPKIFFGITGAYTRNEYRYYPLSDPGLTGVPLITVLPTNFPEGRTEQGEDLFSIRAYGGTGFQSGSWNGRLAASLAYRREFAWTDGTKDQQLCAPPGSPAAPNPNIIRCFSRNIAPPYETEGFHAGLHFRSQFQWLFFPRMAIGADLTYAFNEEQFRLKAPFYFLSGSDGTPNGGIVFDCRLGGETQAGVALDDECTASLFLSTSFRLDAR